MCNGGQIRFLQASSDGTQNSLGPMERSRTSNNFGSPFSILISYYLLWVSIYIVFLYRQGEETQAGGFDTMGVGFVYKRRVGRS